MRAALVLVCFLMMSAGCGLMPTSKPETPSPAPIKREIRIEPIDCSHVPAADPIEAARAANAGDAVTEEVGLAGQVAQLGERLRALWACVNKHTERAVKANSKKQ